MKIKRNAICASMTLALCCCDNPHTAEHDGVPEASVEPRESNSTTSVSSPEVARSSNSTASSNPDETIAQIPQASKPKERPKEKKPDYFSLEVDQLVRLAEDKNPRAAFILGLAHEWGHRVDSDASSAFKWMSLAVAQSEGVARILFKKELLRLSTPLTDTQMEEAGQSAREFWRQKLSELEKKAEEDVQAQFKLGLIYYRGEGFKPKERTAQLAKHMETARNLFETASGQGHSGAAELLGMMLTTVNTGTYTRVAEIKKFADSNKQNEPLLLQAWQALNQATSAGSTRALVDKLELSTHMTPAQLGKVHQESKELLEQKTFLLMEAAKDRDGKPQLRLGLMLYLGQDLPQDQAASAEWLKKAGAKHSSEASSLLASMHFLGEGVEKNLRETYKWYGISHAQGNAAAATGKTEVAKLLSTEQKAAADAEVKAWMEANPKP